MKNSKSPAFLAARLRNNAKDLATVPPYDLASSRTLKSTIKDLEEAAAVLEENAAPSEPEKSDLQHLYEASDEARPEDEPMKIRTMVENVEIITMFWPPANQYITCRRIDNGTAVQILRQAGIAREAAIHHLEVALLAKEGKLPPEPPPRGAPKYGADPGLN